MSDKFQTRVRFLLQENCDNASTCPEEMERAFKICEDFQQSNVTCEWINETKCLKLTGLTEKDVFVLDKFDGPVFDNLKPTKCVIVGPSCLAQCIKERISIPSGPEPVYAVTMRNWIIVASGFTKIIKKAYEQGLPVLALSWIESVWEESLKNSDNGVTIEVEPHNLKIFNGLNVTTTNIGKRDKQKIMKLIRENGGAFSGAFQNKTTDIVVLKKEGVCSEKYKAALEFGKICVLPEWVFDSVERGYAQDVKRYRVSGTTTSSPLPGVKLPNISLNYSTIPGRPVYGFVDETATDCSTMSVRGKIFREPPEEQSEDKLILTAIDKLESGKRALSIFEGYCIYVHGIEGIQRDKLNTLVSKWGGVRYDILDDRVTHALCLSDKLATEALPQNVEYLSPLWLLKSIEAGAPLQEEYFRIVQKQVPRQNTRTKSKEAEPSSPMSKKSLQLLSQGDRPPVPLFKVDQIDENDQNEDNIVQQYITDYNEENVPNQQQSTSSDTSNKVQEPQNKTNSTKLQQEQESSATTCEDDEDVELIFTGLTFEFQGLDEEMCVELASEIELEDGEVREEGGGSNYVIVPLDYSHTLVRRAADHSKVVTAFWLSDCRKQREILPVQYYHKPIDIPENPILKGVVLSISTYTRKERSFLHELAKLLGAVSELRICRKTTASALASTHLICPLPSGDKYAGAVKWGIPAVTGEWLLECAAKGERLPEGPFLVSKESTSTSTVENKENLSKVTIRSRTRMANKISDEIPEEHKRSHEENKRPHEENFMPPPPKRQSGASNNETPKRNGIAMSNQEESDMSLASRYIAMARQGSLCSQETPKRVVEVKRDANYDYNEENVPNQQQSTSSDTSNKVQEPQNKTNSTKLQQEQESSATTCEDDEDVELIFTGLTFEFQGLDEEMCVELASEIELEDGEVREEGGGSNYVIVPLDYSHTLVRRAADHSKVVTAFWLSDCRKQREILPVQYYHKPIDIPENPILKGVVLSISTYTRKERSFLHELAKLLGAVSELRICRKTTASALASTHLICPLPSGDKYAGAVKWGIPAVTGEWLLECAAKGERLPEGPFLVSKESTSTSTVENKENLSKVTIRSRTRMANKISDEIPEEHKRSHEENKRPHEENFMPPPPKRQSGASNNETPKRNGIAMSNQEESDMSLASRYIAMARQGSLCSQETPKRVVEVKRDANYDYNEENVPNQQQSTSSDTSNKVQEPQNKTNSTKLQQEQESSATTCEDDEDVELIFTGLTFEFQGLDEEMCVELASEIELEDGEVREEGGGSNYVIVPLDYSHTLVRRAADHSKVVTAFWLSDCRKQREILPVQYYHKPIDIPENPILKGVVLSISTYTRKERSFLHELAKLLGAVSELRICRKTTASALASTHLICPLPSGDKYAGAVKWGIPAVTGEWLLECAAKGERLPEGPFLVSKEEESDMSLASRYIAMARQGSLCSQETPKRVVEVKRDANYDAVKTPDFKLSTPNLKNFTPTTRRRLEAMRRGELPSGPIRTPDATGYKNIKTPDSGFGGALAVGGKLSPNSRKQLWSDIESMATPGIPRLQVTKETPFSEFCNKIVTNLCQRNAVKPTKLGFNDSEETPPSEIAKIDIENKTDEKVESRVSTTLDLQLEHISNELQSRTMTPRQSLAESRVGLTVNERKEPQASEEQYIHTQTEVVAWDDSSQVKDAVLSDIVENVPSPVQVKRFMMSSNFENCEELAQMILHLGGEVSELSELDLEATHLLYSNLGSSEKLLGSIAAGKWLLHPSYIARSYQAGTFLAEDDFEWGNETASCLKGHAADVSLAYAAKRWRQRKAENLPAAYHGFRAILHVYPTKRLVFARIIKAGGGQVIEESPPYSCKTATHCFVEKNKYLLERSDLEFFARNKIPVCSTIFLHKFLVEVETPSAVEHAIPEYKSLIR